MTAVGLLARLLRHLVLVDRQSAQLCSAGADERSMLGAEPSQGVLEQPAVAANSKIPTIVYFIVRCCCLCDQR